MKHNPKKGGHTSTTSPLSDFPAPSAPLAPPLLSTSSNLIWQRKQWVAWTHKKYELTYPIQEAVTKMSFLFHWWDMYGYDMLVPLEGKRVTWIPPLSILDQAHMGYGDATCLLAWVEKEIQNIWVLEREECPCTNIYHTLNQIPTVCRLGSELHFRKKVIFYQYTRDRLLIDFCHCFQLEFWYPR